MTDIPTYIFNYLCSFFQYAYQILVVNEFKDGNFEPCDPKEGRIKCPFGYCRGDDEMVAMKLDPAGTTM
jgi:hypothetical protein